MGILLAFAPFIVFAVVDRFGGSTIALFAGAAVSAALIVRDLASSGRSPKILEIGTLILFAALAVYAVVGDPHWSIFGVRLAVDAGLLAIVLISIAVRVPFTMQYAREQVAPEFWNHPRFRRVNDIISAGWAAAFAVMVAADAVLVYVPALPPVYGIVVTVLALYAAIRFTAWYPARVRREQAAAG